MRQMTAVRQIHPHHSITGSAKRHINRHVSLRTAVRLDISPSAFEKLHSTIHSEVFTNVNEGAPAVISPAGIAFSVFIGHHRTHSFENSEAGEVLRSYHFQSMILASCFAYEGIIDFRVGIFQVI